MTLLGLLLTALPLGCSRPEVGLGPRKVTVLAHYMPQFPLSIDNLPAGRDYYSTQWLRPSGENAKHRASGGYLRDRPLPTAPKPGDYERVNARKEIRQAKAAGIDGFNVNIQNKEGTPLERAESLAEAADDVGDFQIIPTLDTHGELGRLDARRAAAVLARFYVHPAVSDQGLGPTLSSFACEEMPVDWWIEVLTELERLTHREIAFHAVLLDSSRDNVERFVPLATTIGSWGGRTPDRVANEEDTAMAVTSNQRQWMAPIAVQDVRPQAGLYAEAGNTELLRASWAMAQTTKAPLVQLVTWNDYAENTHMAPSRNHGDAFLQLDKYFIDRLRSGASGPAAKAQVLVTMRTQRSNAKAVTHSLPMRPNLAGSTLPPRDMVEVLTILPSSGVVKVTAGSAPLVAYEAKQGLDTRLFPATEGKVTVELDASPTCRLTTRTSLQDQPEVQDLTYHAERMQCR